MLQILSDSLKVGFVFFLSEFVGHTMDDADLSQKGRTNTPVQEKPATAKDSNVSYQDLMARIRHIVLTNRLRVRSLSFTSKHFLVLY